VKNIIELLGEAVWLAVCAHTDQQDKAGKPYIHHPLRVMSNCNTQLEMIVAVLHDVIEDTYVTQDHLKRLGFPSEVLEALDCLTRRENEAYKNFILRIKSNKLATIVKLHDLKDNMDRSRMKVPDESLMQRYQKAYEELTK
jgi:(p)ppGpp synthase/HD superfamily hydrolase